MDRHRSQVHRQIYQGQDWLEEGRMTGDPYRSGIFLWTRRSSRRCSSKTSAKVLKVKGKSTTRQATAARVVASALGVTFGVHQKLLLNAAWQGSGSTGLCPLVACAPSTQYGNRSWPLSRLGMLRMTSSPPIYWWHRACLGGPSRATEANVKMSWSDIV